jgi:hypothetical protein
MIPNVYQGNASVFHIPNSYPNEPMPVCNSTPSSHVVIEELFYDDEYDLEVTDILESSAKASMTPKNRKGKRTILSDSDVRRSLRTKKMHKGFCRCFISNSLPRGCTRDSCSGFGVCRTRRLMQEIVDLYWLRPS